MRLYEALVRAPVTPSQVSEFMALMNRPIMAKDAILLIHKLLDDDGLFDILDDTAMKDPKRDVRPIIAEWIKQHYPAMLRNSDNDELADGHWIRSVISSHPGDITK